MVAPQVRLELTTLRLTAECSAIELLRIIFSIHLFSYVWEREKLPFLPLPCGSRQLPTLPSRSQLSTISVWRLNFCVRYGYRWCPPAIVTGNFPFGALFIASRPLRFALRFRFAHSPLLSLPLPAPSKLHRSELTSKLFTLFRLLLDQALDRLVSASSTPHSASTADLSTSSSLRGLTCFKQWQSSSSGGLHA